MNIYEILSQNCRQSPLFAFLTSLIIYLLGSIILLPIIAFIIAMIFGFDQAAIQNILMGSIEGTQSELAVFRLIQGSNQLVSWGLAGVVMAYLLGKPGDVLSLHQRSNSIILFPIFIILLGLPLVQASAFNEETFQLPEFLSGLEEWARVRETQSQEMLMKILAPSGIGILIFNLLIFAVLPAICEEIFFRGYLQGLFLRLMNPHLAIVLVAFIFSAIHLQFYGFFPRFFLGILLGYFVYASGSLFPAMLAHFFFNGFSIVLVQLADGQNLISTDLNQNTVEMPFYIVAFSLVTTILGLIFYFRLSSRQSYE